MSFLFFFFFNFIFKLYITVLVLPNIKMNPPQVYVFSIMVSSGYMPSTGIFVSYGSFNPSF